MRIDDARGAEPAPATPALPGMGPADERWLRIAHVEAICGARRLLTPGHADSYAWVQGSIPGAKDRTGRPCSIVDCAPPGAERSPRNAWGLTVCGALMLACGRLCADAADRPDLHREVRTRMLLAVYRGIGELDGPEGEACMDEVIEDVGAPPEGGMLDAIDEWADEPHVGPGCALELLDLAAARETRRLEIEGYGGPLDRAGGWLPEPPRTDAGRCLL